MRWRQVAGSVLLVAVLTAVSAPVSAQTPTPSPSSAGSMVAPSTGLATAPIAVTLSDFDIAPDVIEVPDPNVAFRVTNDGITPHNFSLRDETGALVGATDDLGQGESAELDAELSAAGSYTFFCSLPGHESLGMSGSIVLSSGLVEEPSATPV